MTSVSSSSPRLVEVFDQRRERGVGRRQQVGPGPFQVIAVAVVALAPLAVVVADPVDVDQPDARLDHPPGQQDRLPEDVPAVAVAHRVGLGLEVEGALGGRRGDQVEGAAVLDVEIRGRFAAVAEPRLRLQHLEQRAAVAEAERR